MTGLVVVSHSRALADAAVALASEMLHGSTTRIAVAAGLDAETFGTDATAIVDAIEKGAPALGALEAGDRITAVDGRRVRTRVEAIRAIRARRVGATVRLSVVRDGADRVVRVPTVGARVPGGGEVPVIGVILAPRFTFPFDVTIDAELGKYVNGLADRGHFDAVQVGSSPGMRCPIREIRPVDLQTAREAERQARGESVTDLSVLPRQLGLFEAAAGGSGHADNPGHSRDLRDA
mgnify:CR=1 FL=1